MSRQTGRDTLARSAGNRHRRPGGAAEILGMKRTTLNSRIRLLKQRLDEKA